MYARVHEGVITEILRPIEGFTIEQCFHSDLLASCTPVQSQVEVGWVLQEDGTFAAPVTTLPEPIPAQPEAPVEGA